MIGLGRRSVPRGISAKQKPFVCQQNQIIRQNNVQNIAKNRIRGSEGRKTKSSAHPRVRGSKKQVLPGQTKVKLGRNVKEA